MIHRWFLKTSSKIVIHFLESVDEETVFKFKKKIPRQTKGQENLFDGGC